MAGKRRTERTEGQARADFVRICCYVALVLAAVLIFIDNLLPLLEIDVGGAFFDVLRLIKDVALLLGIVFLVLLAADQITKAVAFAVMGENAAVTMVIPGFLGFNTVLNEGISFSIGEGGE